LAAAQKTARQQAGPPPQPEAAKPDFPAGIAGAAVSRRILPAGKPAAGRADFGRGGTGPAPRQ